MDADALDLKQSIVDCAVSQDRTEAVVKTSDSVAVLSTATGKLLSSRRLPGGASLTGLAISPDGGTVACSNAGRSIYLFPLSAGRLGAPKEIHLPTAKIGGDCYPCGIAYLADHLLVAANRDNSLLVLDADGTFRRRIPVDTAPYSILTVDASHVFVTCWAGPNKPGRPTAPSAGTPVEVDRRGIGVGGSICDVNIETGTVDQRKVLPLQPTEMAPGNASVFVACANGDAVLELDGNSLRTLRTIRLDNSPSGSAPDSVALDSSARTLYVSFGGLDRIGAYDLRQNRWIGFQRTEWYPSSVRWIPQGLLVATAKGIGSRSGTGSKRGVYDLTSSVSCISDPRFTDPLPSVALDGPPRRGERPGPVPERTGEPSLIKHVVYVIKENRTYDQLMGDVAEGNGDASLTMYGEQVTPNHHAIAREFVLLDNYYCNGILSADGHAWATEANATTYYEHTRGAWVRSYPFGDDPLATSSSGYLWDNALDHGRTVRNFGEFDYAGTPSNENAFDILKRFRAGDQEKFDQNIGVARLRTVSERDYPGWNLAIPDVLRADRFGKRLKELERGRDGMADLTIVYLPQDHTSGGSPGYPTPRAQVADNDLGLGRVLEALSHSRFWATSVLFAEEDDPQDGFDHVDGHRSLCLVAGPWVRRGVVISRFYNQASVIHTMERILGLPPMNVNDAEAPVMTECFQDEPDLRPYDAKPNRIALDERNAHAVRTRFDLSRPDNVDDRLFNRRLWALSGKPGPYPGP